MQPTPEQARAVDLFRTGENLRINAFAGSGKTSTLRFLAASTERRGVYLAFNGSIAAEARRKFPERVTTQTIHSYAYRRILPAFGGRTEKLTGDLSVRYIADLLGLGPLVPSRRCYLTPRMVAALVKSAVQRFTQSADLRPLRTHVPRLGSTRELSWLRFRALSGVVAAHADTLWERMKDPASDTPLGHDGYLKLWILTRPQIPADYVLLDEAQDSSGAVIGLLAAQPCQVVTVGDRHQQIYEWRGAVNAMDRLKARHTADLTRSFRFGEAIAGAATRVLRILGERKRILGNDAITSALRCATPDALLCRTNTMLLAKAIEAQESGRSVATLGGGRELLGLLEDVERLQQGYRSVRPAFFGYRRWTEVVKAAEGEEGTELRGLVGLVERFGVPGLRKCLGALAPEEKPGGLLLATVHKAKGREWPRVAVAEDFTLFRKRRGGGRQIQRENVRLFYVAMTRAREEVEIPRRLAREAGIR